MNENQHVAFFRKVVELQKKSSNIKAPHLHGILAEVDRLTAELKKFDPDPVVCGCHEALCPHTPIAKLPRQELVNLYKRRIRYLTGCIEDTNLQEAKLRARIESLLDVVREAVDIAEESGVGGDVEYGKIMSVLERAFEPQ